MILNKDYWRLRYDLVTNSILYNIKNINFVSYFKKQKNLQLYLSQLISSISYYDVILSQREYVNEHQLILKQKSICISELDNEIQQTKKKIVETEDKLKNIKSKFDEMRIYDSLEVFQKDLKSSIYRYSIVEKQINECKKNLSKHVACLCESYLCQSSLKKMKYSAYKLLETINYQYYQTNKIFYPFLSYSFLQSYRKINY